jgi:hypothetical protein
MVLFMKTSRLGPKAYERFKLSDVTLCDEFGALVYDKRFYAEFDSFHFLTCLKCGFSNVRRNKIAERDSLSPPLQAAHDWLTSYWKQNPVEVRQMQMVNGEKHEYYLCHVCAGKKKRKRKVT